MSYNKDTNWANEEEYLNNLIKTGNPGEQSWAKTQLGVLAQDKAKYGNAITPTTPTVNQTGTGEKTYQATADGEVGNVRGPVQNNNQMDILNNVTPTTGTYTPTGTYNDADLPPEALTLIQSYKKAYDDAIARGDTAAAEEAHRLAEGVRALYGYSGGTDGSEYIELNTTPVTESVYTPSSNSGLSSGDILSWNENYNAENEQPTYESKYDPAIEALLNEILTREDFSYNVENDPLFAQYKTMYNREGDRAMRDTLAEAAANAGGMNSYAISAAQQANNYYASQLNDKIPELYQLAYEMYLQDKESKIQDLGLLTQMDDRQYSMYRDLMGDWWNDKSFAYGAFSDAVSQGNWEKNFNSNEYWNEKEWTANDQAAAKDEVWNLISLGVTPSADLIARAGMSQTDIDLAVAAVKAGGTGYSDDNNNNNGYKPKDDENDNNNIVENTPVATGITEEIKTKCASFTNNIDLADYLDSLELSGAIGPEESDQLYASYKDNNEKYKVDESGAPTNDASYSDMINSTQGWEIQDDGGVNWFWGLDNNAILKAPNGEQIRIDVLLDKLIEEGMDKTAAKNAIKKLQKNLDI